MGSRLFLAHVRCLAAEPGLGRLVPDQTHTRMDWRDHVHRDPAILQGKHVVRGTRLSVEFLLERMAAGWSKAEILGSYPGLKTEDLRACLAFAAETMREERFYALAS